MFMRIKIEKESLKIMSIKSFEYEMNELKENLATFSWREIIGDIQQC